jgi:hypothetical protein
MERKLFHAALIVAIAAGACLALGPPAEAQSCVAGPIPWPDGCSVPYSPEWVRRGLDKIFLGACINHDYCYATCNGPTPPYLGLSWKAGCDAQLGVDMATACAVEAAVIAFPLDDIPDAETFLEVCGGVAATFTASVALFGSGAFWSDQCCLGCSPDGCANSGQFLPATCGTGYGNGFCYVNPPPGGGGGGGGGGDDGDCSDGSLVTVEECEDECGGTADLDAGECLIDDFRGLPTTPMSALSPRTTSAPAMLLRIPVHPHTVRPARRHRLLVPPLGPLPGPGH